MTGWTLLALAIAAEVAGTTALRASNGLTRTVPTGISAIAFIASFALLALTLKHLTLTIAFIGRAVYHELISFTTAAGIALVVVGVVVIHVGGGVSR